MKRTRKKQLAKQKPEPRRWRPPGEFDVRESVAQGLGLLFRGLKVVAATAVVALTTTDEQIEAAGGDFIEAMNGHKCGPDCWHAQGSTPEERQAWWDERIKKCRADRDARIARQYGVGNIKEEDKHDHQSATRKDDAG